MVHFWGFFVQAAGFQALAVLLPVPAYGVSWPSSLPRDRHVAGDEWIASDRASMGRLMHDDAWIWKSHIFAGGSHDHLRHFRC